MEFELKNIAYRFSTGVLGAIILCLWAVFGSAAACLLIDPNWLWIVAIAGIIGFSVGAVWPMMSIEAIFISASILLGIFINRYVDRCDRGIDLKYARFFRAGACAAAILAILSIYIKLRM